MYTVPAVSIPKVVSYHHPAGYDQLLGRNCQRGLLNTCSIEKGTIPWTWFPRTGTGQLSISDKMAA